MGQKLISHALLPSCLALFKNSTMKKLRYLLSPGGPARRAPASNANLFEQTGGLAVFGLPKALRRALHFVWLPVALAVATVLAIATPAGAGLAALASLTFAGAHGAGLIGATTCFILGSALLASAFYRHADGRAHAPTLIATELLMDVIGAFQKYVPALSSFGAQWTAQTLKLNQKYTAQIAVYGSASTYDTTTGYANGANTARNGLVDVSVITKTQPTYPLKWLHLDGIKDNKNQYAKVMAGAGYTLGKSCLDTGFFAKMTSRFFSQEDTTAVADCEYDWLQGLVTKLNAKGVEPMGRVLFVNSAVAAVLAVDPRMISKDFAGQILDGNGYRQWRNVGGFALIQEYPDLPSNNGTALTSVTAEADDDLFTKASHGLETGDPVVLTAMTSVVGVTVGTRYWVIKVSSSTFKLATTYALAMAGTGIDITTDGTAGTITPTENLIAFACDGRAFASLAGVPDGMTVMAQQLGVVQTLTFDFVKDPNTGIMMAAAKYQEPATGDLIWCPTFIYGTNAGKQGDTAVATNTAAANSALAAANAAGTAADYAGLRISSGAT